MSELSIPLTRGLCTRVSIEDFARLSQYKWHAVPARNTHYAARRVGDRTIYMHRLVMGLDGSNSKVFVDHINHDGLDNRRENLRESDYKKNAQNRRYKKDFLGLRGVRQVGDRWEAQISVDGTLIYLGSFQSEREAGIAYSAACRAIGRDFYEFTEIRRVA